MYALLFVFPGCGVYDFYHPAMMSPDGLFSRKTIMVAKRVKDFVMQFQELRKERAQSKSQGERFIAQSLQGFRQEFISARFTDDHMELMVGAGIGD